MFKKSINLKAINKGPKSRLVYHFSSSENLMHEALRLSQLMQGSCYLVVGGIVDILEKRKSFHHIKDIALQGNSHAAELAIQRISNCDDKEAVAKYLVDIALNGSSQYARLHGAQHLNHVFVDDDAGLKNITLKHQELVSSTLYELCERGREYLKSQNIEASENCLRYIGEICKHNDSVAAAHAIHYLFSYYITSHEDFEALIDMGLEGQFETLVLEISHKFSSDNVIKNKIGECGYLPFDTIFNMESGKVFSKSFDQSEFARTLENYKALALAFDGNTQASKTAVKTLDAKVSQQEWSLKDHFSNDHFGFYDFCAAKVVMEDIESAQVNNHIRQLVLELFHPEVLS